MTTPTVSERVLEAVTKGLEIIELMNQARATLLVKKRGEDEVRGTNEVPRVEKDGTSLLQRTAEAAEATFSEAVEIARKPLNEAQAVFDRTVAELAVKRDMTIRQVVEGCKVELAAARHKQELREATARAEVHTASQNLAALEQTRDSYRRQVQQQLGIDLNALLPPGG